MNVPQSSPNSRRVFVACLLSFLLSISPLAAVAATMKSSVARASQPAVPAPSSAPAQPKKEEIVHQTGGVSTTDNFLSLFAPVGTPTIVATKVDAFPDHSNGGKARPGDAITYTVTITNTGTGDATGVQFNDAIDPNTTFVPGSTTTQPIAVADAYNVIGNVEIQPNAAAGILANDCDPDPNGGPCTNTGLTVSVLAGDNSSPFSGTSAQGGQVTSSTTDGAFIYNPAPGFTGQDTFTYTVTDATGKTDTATVTLQVGNGTATPGTNVIWFVNPSAPVGGDGRLTSPFNCYTGTNNGAQTCFSATAADDPGDTIFLFSGSHTGGNTLLNNQKLVGAGASATLASITGFTVPTGSDALPTTGGVSPTITTAVAATNGVNLGQGNLLRGFTVGNTTGAKIFGSNFGTLTAGNNTTPDMILNGSGQALNLSNGTFAATSAFTSVATTSSGTQGINLATIVGTVSFGSTTVSGNTTQCILVATSTGNISFGDTSCAGGTDGISLQNNSAGTRTFGKISITGGTGKGFLHAVGGGTTTVTDTTTINNASSTGAIDIQNSTTLITFANVAITNVSGPGVNLVSNSGGVTFADLDITPASGNKAFVATNNTGTITTTSGDLSSTGNTVLDIVGQNAANRTPLSMSLTSLASTNNANAAGTGANLNFVSGGLTVTGVTNIQNPAGVGIAIQNTPAGTAIAFQGNTTSNASGDTGILLNSNAGSVTFPSSGTFSVTPDSGVRGIVASSNTGTITSSVGTVTTTNAAAIDVSASAVNLVLDTVSATISNVTAASGVTVTGATTGTINLKGGAISGGNAAAFLVNSGTANIAYAGTVSQANAQRVIDVQSRTGGTVTFSGAITATAGTGVILNSNTGATISFTGGMSLSTGANAAFTATGGGTVTATQNNSSIVNTLATTTGTALNVTSTTIGAAGLTFRSIAVTGNNTLPTNGIVLNTTGSSGSLTVTGNGTASSGGTITATGGNGVQLTTTEKVSLTRMNISSNKGSGIGGSGINGLQLDNCTLNTNGDSAAADESGINVTQLTGDATHLTSITNCTIQNNFEFQIQISNSSGTLTNLTMSGNTISTTAASGISGNLFNFLGGGTSVMKLTLTSGSFTGNWTPASPVPGPATISGTAIAAVTQGTTHTVNVSGATFTNNNAGVDCSTTMSATTFNCNVSNNNFQGTRAIVINSFHNGNAPFNRTFNGTFSTNIIGTAGVANSGSYNGRAIDIDNEGAITTANYTITNNTINEVGVATSAGAEGIAVNVGLGGQATGGGSTQATITGNTIGNIRNSRGLVVQDNQDPAFGPFPSLCANISGNTFSGVIAGQAGNGQFMRIREGSGTVRVTQDTPTAANTATELDNANNFTDPTKISIGGTPTFSQPACTGSTAMFDIESNGSDEQLAQADGAALDSMRNPEVSSSLASSASQPSVLVASAPSTSASEAQQLWLSEFFAPASDIKSASTIDAAPAIASTNTASPTDLLSLLSLRPAEVVPATQTASAAKPLELKKARRNALLQYSAHGSSPTRGKGNNVRGKGQAQRAAQPKHLPLAPPPPACTNDSGHVCVQIGTLRPGDSVQITFQAMVNSPFNGGTTVSNQGSVSYNESGTPVLTDDTAVAGSADPTVTPIEAVQISINDISIAEGAVGLRNATFTVSLSNTSGSPTTVHYQTADNTAVAPGDYIAVTDTVLTIPPSTPSATITVQVKGDTTFEGNETFFVNLSNASGGTILDSQGICTINDDEPQMADFDGDGLADASVWGVGNFWRSINSSDNQPHGATNWGNNNGPGADVGVPGDYDGDGKTDVAVWRPSEGNWYVLKSSDSTLLLQGWGASTDKPVPADYDGDGKTDYAVFRPSEGNWYIRKSSGGVTVTGWGNSSDKLVPADYDGDGKADIAVYRPSEGNWYIINSGGGGITIRPWGNSSDTPVIGDYDGDGKADLAVYRASEANWYIRNSASSTTTVKSWGVANSNDVPVPADYDGDGRTDVAIWRPSEGDFYIIKSETNTLLVLNLGFSNDMPVPRMYQPQ